MSGEETENKTQFSKTDLFQTLKKTDLFQTLSGEETGPKGGFVPQSMFENIPKKGQTSMCHI